MHIYVDMDMAFYGRYRDLRGTCTVRVNDLVMTVDAFFFFYSFFFCLSKSLMFSCRRLLGMNAMLACLL